MIRPSTVVTALMFLASGAYMFAVKHRAQTIDQQIAAVTQATRADEERIRVLNAQWALEVDPQRVKQLAAQFTTLSPMKPHQLVTLQALAAALPAAGSAAPGAAPAVPQVLAVAAPVVAVVAVPKKMAAAPARVASLAGVENVLHHLNAPHHAHAVRVANSVMTPKRYGAQAPLYEPPAPQIVAARVVVPAVGEGGSMLGMAQPGASN
jgi:hypothetical protein